MIASLRLRAPWSATFVVIATLLPSGSVAHAQESEEERTAAARALFEEGMGLVAEGRVEDAADRLRRSHALRASPIVLFNLSTALIGLGELVGASEHLRAIVSDEEAPEVVREAARERLDALLPRIAQLVVRLDGPSEGVDVRVDDVPLDAALIGVAHPIDPGLRVVVAIRAELEVARESVELPEGGRAEIELQIPPLPPPPSLAPVEVVHAEERAEAQVAASLRVEAPPPAEVDVGLVVLFTGLGAAVVAGIVTAIVLASPMGPQPIPGDFEPGIVRSGG